MRHCCAECFGDGGLRESIIPSLSESEGTCDFCDHKGVALVTPDQLAPYFQMLVDAYTEQESGKPLVEWLRDDWLIFPDMDNAHAKELLSEVLDDGDIVRRNFVPSLAAAQGQLSQWADLRGEIMHKNRWFLDTSINLDRLRELLDLLIAPKEVLQRTWHRSRLLNGSKIYSAAEMGAPPNHLAAHGRANPAGIPYLYLGSTAETAVAETRPHTGESACVAEFAIPDIRAVDLRSPRAKVSPFILADTNEILQLWSDLPLLERLGEELTRPVVPSGAAFAYIPSQYLCEFVKKSGFDGVVYRSSVSDGINLALFEPSLAISQKVSVLSVERVSVQIAETVLDPA